MKNLRKNKKGFTLVELMVVVAIMGILVAVAIPVFNDVTKKAEATTCRGNIRIIESAFLQMSVLDGLTGNLAYEGATITATTKPTGASKTLTDFLKGDVPQCKTDKGVVTPYNITATGIITCPNAAHNPTAKPEAKP